MAKKKKASPKPATRLIINLDSAEKQWLAAESIKRDVSMATVIREALATYRSATRTIDPEFDTLLQETSGIWKHGDGLDYQQKSRSEWDK